MKAISFDEFGAPDVLHLVEVPLPEPADAQVRVKVAAAGVNPADWKVRSGQSLFGAPTFPQYPGFEIAGVVDAVGPTATEWAVGDQVFGWTIGGRGGYAEYALAARLVRKPAGLSFQDAVALPVAVSTADGALELLACKPGETLLVNGAAGAVGSMAVQLASAAGVTVIGTGSPANADIIRALGATPTTYGEGVVARVRELSPAGVDAVLDASGHGFLTAAMELRGSKERIVTIADGAAFELDIPFHRGGGSRSLEALREVADGLVAGAFRLPAPPRAFPLAEAAAAQIASESGGKPGKVVLLP